SKFKQKPRRHGKFFDMPRFGVEYMALFQHCLFITLSQYSRTGNDCQDFALLLACGRQGAHRSWTV
ncbi:MAG TPA: hypothetical protein VGC21_07255, partial [Telluria sp.]